MAMLEILSNLAEDFLFISQSKPTLDRAIEIIRQETDQVYSRGDIRSMLNVSFAGSRMIEIRVISEDREEAALIANAVAEAAIGRIGEVTLSDPPTIVERAEEAATPIPSRVNAPVGAVVGMLLVMIVLTVHFFLSDKIKTEEDVRKYLGLNTLAVIPEGNRKIL